MCASTAWFMPAVQPLTQTVAHSDLQSAAAQQGCFLLLPLQQVAHRLLDICLVTLGCSWGAA